MLASLTMDLESLIKWFLSFPESEETTPFGPEILVYKVAGKMFAATNPDNIPSAVNLKCDPERALELRDLYPAVNPGWHMNKKHWNTVTLDGSLSDDLLLEMVRDSYRLVVLGMKKCDRDRLLEQCAF